MIASKVELWFFHMNLYLWKKEDVYIKACNLSKWVC
jgi:hypothetical protein